MRIRPVADPEMVKRILTSVQTPELRSLLLQIVQDQRITNNARERLASYFTSQRPRKTRSKLRIWLMNALNR